MLHVTGSLGYSVEGEISQAVAKDTAKSDSPLTRPVSAGCHCYCVGNVGRKCASMLYTLGVNPRKQAYLRTIMRRWIETRSVGVTCSCSAYVETACCGVPRV